MSIVDLSKARAWAECTDHIAGDWINELADEVESLTVALDTARSTRDAAVADTKKLQAERDAAVAGLQELHTSIATMLREARHIAEYHPEPAAAGAALRILREQP